MCYIWSSATKKCDPRDTLLLSFCWPVKQYDQIIFENLVAGWRAVNLMPLIAWNQALYDHLAGGDHITGFLPLMALGWQYSTVDIGKKRIELDICGRCVVSEMGCIWTLTTPDNQPGIYMSLRTENAPLHLPNEKILRNSILRNRNR